MGRGREREKRHTGTQRGTEGGVRVGRVNAKRVKECAGVRGWVGSRLEKCDVIRSLFEPGMNEKDKMSVNTYLLTDIRSV